MAKKVVKKQAKKTGTAVAVHKAAVPAPPVTFIEFLDRASRNPKFDAAKFQIVMAAKERQDARAAEAEFDNRMAEVQRELAPIRADMQNPQTKSNYASDVAIDAKIRPIYSKHGFALSFGTGDNPPADHVRVTCRVSCAGHHRTEHFDIPVVTTGPKGNDVMTKVHATGSAGTYGRRYLLMLIFNLMVVKKKGAQTEPLADDDGNAASGVMESGFISESQTHEINLLMTETKSKTDLFLTMLSEIGKVKIDKVSDIPASLYQTAMAKLKLKKERTVQSA